MFFVFEIFEQYSDRRSIYKGAALLKDWHTGEVIKVLSRKGYRKEEEVKESEDMLDQVVQAFSFLSKEFTDKFNNIAHVEETN